MLQTTTTLVSPPTRVVSRIFTRTGQFLILSRLCYLKYFLTNVDQPRLRPDWILIILGLFSLDGSQQSLPENIHGVGDAHPPVPLLTNQNTELMFIDQSEHNINIFDKSELSIYLAKMVILKNRFVVSELSHF